MCGADLCGGLTLPITVNSAVSDGLDFGLDAAPLEREDFERALQRRIAAIKAIFLDDGHIDGVIAAFDQAAWGGWEIGRRHSR